METALQKPQTADRSGMGLITLAALIWGTIGVAVSLLYQLAPAEPLEVGFLRLLISAPALLIVCRWLVGPTFLRISRGHLAVMGLMGVAFAGYQVFYFAAIAQIGVATAVMINICSAPIFTAFLSRVFLKEKLSGRAILAIVIAISGTALLVGGAPEASSSSALLIGALLALGAGLCYSIVALCGRALAPHYHVLQPITVSFSIGALVLAPFALSGGLYLAYPPLAWGLLIYLGIVPTAVAYTFYLRGLRTTPATIAATLTLLEPLGSTILAILFLNESLTPIGYFGAGLLLLSMPLLYGGGSKDAAEK